MRHRIHLGRINTGLLLALWMASVSCGKDPAASSQADPGDIRGTPINEPVPSAAASEPTAGEPAVPAALTPASQPEPVSVVSETAAVAEAPGSSAPPAAPAPVESADGTVILGFDRLASFPYEMPEDLAATNEVETAQSQIPEAIRALDKRQVALKGFMLPLKVEGGLVTELLILRDQSMCCYGTVPKINEWVSVKMGQKGVKPVMDQPVTIHGRLHVGEIRENGYLVGIYAMDGEKMTGPLDL